jgi:cob(I)alamin adenosyltransferase
MASSPIYTRSGDDGTTGLFYGGRVSKDHSGPHAYGDVDETQAALGIARASASGSAGRLDIAEVLLELQRDLWVVMAELATAKDNRPKLADDVSRVSPAMVQRLEPLIDRFTAQFEPIRDFVVPGNTVLGAQLDVARTIARRAERSAVTHVREMGIDSEVVRYLNRLSDLLWTLARAADGESVRAKDV